MPQNTPDVGADVAALCGKCKRETWHVVIAKVGNEIAKVQCKLCDSYHRYRPPGGGASARSGRRQASGTGAKRSRKPPPPPPEPPRPKVAPDLGRPVRRYRVDERFEPGERLEHVTFGAGVVEETLASKIVVFFYQDAQRKTLAQAGPAPRLTRPPPLSE